MVKFILIPVIIMLSCGSTKTNQSAAKTDTVITEEPVMNQRDSAIIPQVTEATDAAMPKCDGLVLTFVRPDDLEAVEVYNNESKLPAEFRWHPRASCGVVLFWTRAGNSSPKKRQ